MPNGQGAGVAGAAGAGSSVKASMNSRWWQESQIMPKSTSTAAPMKMKLGPLSSNRLFMGEGGG